MPQPILVSCTSVFHKYVIQNPIQKQVSTAYKNNKWYKQKKYDNDTFVVVAEMEIKVWKKVPVLLIIFCTTFGGYHCIQVIYVSLNWTLHLRWHLLRTCGPICWSNVDSLIIFFTWLHNQCYGRLGPIKKKQKKQGWQDSLFYLRTVTLFPEFWKWEFSLLSQNPTLH